MRLCIHILLLLIVLPATARAQRYIHNVPEAIVSVSATEQGSIIAISQSGKLYEYDGANFDLLQEGLTGASGITYSEGQYIIISDSGVYKYQAEELEHQRLSEICYSYISVEGKEYVLTPTGMQQYREGRYQLVNEWTEAITPTAKFHQIENTFYLSNRNAIYQYKSDQWKIIARDTFVINDLVNYNGDLWAATDSGLRVMKDRLLKQVVLDGLDAKMKISNLYTIQNDLYLQGEGSLLKWNSKDYQVHRIDAKSSPSNLVQDPWGDIWFADEGNIIQHKIGKLTQSTPIISNVDIYIDGTLQSGNKIEILEEGSDVRVIYDANHLRQPQDVKFQSLLTPLDSKYQAATTDKSIVYTDVPAGNYKYRLRSTIDGVHYDYSDAIEIKIKAKDEISSLWWILAAVCLGLLFLALLSNYRLQQYKERSSLLTAKLRTANELLTSQQKTMQLQMNPHFLFNALNSIQGLVSLNRNDEAKKYLKTFSRMMRSVLDFSTVDKIDIQSEITYLRDYISIEQMTRANSFDYDIDIDDTLLDDDVKIPPMILQPFVENAIIHGVASISNGNINIEIKDQETQILCIITDNGIGRKASAKKKKSNHKSVAISLAKERLRKLSNSQTLHPIQYVDLEKGTQVKITIPI